MSLLSVIKQANQPGPPEDSIALRVSATAAVAIAIAACRSQGELSLSIAVSSIALIVLGNVFSYFRRRRAFPMLKVVLAIAVVAAFGWFFTVVSRDATVGDLASVEGPLAVLFTIIQVTHAFDVPSRRDLSFSLAGSATLMAAAGAQAVNESFAIYIALWAITGLAGLLTSWGSMAGGIRLRPRTVLLSGCMVLVLAIAVIAALPAPHANSSLSLPASLATDLPVSQPGGLLGNGKSSTEPVHAAAPGGRIGTGGFLGFAGPLNTADRISLSNQIVFQVRADQPSYWVAETFDDWSGQSWEQAPAAVPAQLFQTLRSGSPFQLPFPVGDAPHGKPDYQTFYLSAPGPNLIFHADQASAVWFPAKKIYANEEGTIRSGTSLGPGSIYTVVSNVAEGTPAQFETADNPVTPSEAANLLPEVVNKQSLQLPHPYPQVAKLARTITAGASSTYDKVMDLERWIGQHTKYTTNIPPLPPGQDTVNAFLFGSRRGYCEQISTSLAVMLRTLGVPAREAAGYVPGTYNPFTDLYVERANDAHAWVQVWFPRLGWQSFDPTAFVASANPTPGDVIGHDLTAEAKRVPWTPIGGTVLVLIIASVLIRRFRRRPRTWTEAVSRDLTTAARRAGVDVEPFEPLIGIAVDLIRATNVDTSGHPDMLDAVDVALAAEAVAFGKHTLDKNAVRSLRRSTRRIRRQSKSMARRARSSSLGGGAKVRPGREPSEPRRTRHRPREEVGTP